MADETYDRKVYHEQEGERFVCASGGSIDIESGGELDIESGGALKLAGTAVTADAAELNKMEGVTAATSELNYTDIATRGAAEADKALVTDGNNDLTALRNLTQTGYRAEPVESINSAISSTAGTTGFATIANFGTSILSCTGSTATSLCGFRLPAPTVGVEKKIYANLGIDATHDAIVESADKTVTFGSTTGQLHRLSFDAVDECVYLVGLTVTQWAILSNTGGVATSTDFTT